MEESLLRDALIRLAHENPDLRQHLVPLLRMHAGRKPTSAEKAEAKKLFDKWRSDASSPGERDDLDETWESFLSGDLTLKEIKENPPTKEASDKQAIRFPPMPREFHLPKAVRDQPAFEPEGTNLAVWKWEDAGKYYAIVFQGRAQKPLWYHSFRDEMSRERYLKGTIDSNKASLSRKQERQDAKKNFQHGIKVGDIFYSSWGYDQTNVDWYEVVSAPEGTKMVIVREIGGHAVSSSSGSDKVVPVPGHFVGPPLRKIPQYGGPGGKAYLKVTDDHWAHAWDGKPKHETSSGWGH